MVPRNSPSSGKHADLPRGQDGVDHDPDSGPDAEPATLPYDLSPTPTNQPTGRANRGSGDFRHSLALPQTGGNRFVRNTPVLTPGVSRSQSASPFRLAMPSNSPGQLAFSALQFLPLPVLVLDNFKTVALANEAMGRLLGMGTGMGHQDSDGMVSLMDTLRGQSLSQVGIDLIQDNGPVWIEWEQFLDQVATEMGTCKTTDSNKSIPLVDGHSTPTRATTVDGNNDGFADTAHCPSRNATVEVVISKRDFARMPFDARPRSKHGEPQSFAKMIISPWQLDDRQSYFTLTFTFTEGKRSSPQPDRTYTSDPETIELADAKFVSNVSGPPSQSSNCSHDSRSASYIISPSSVSLSSSPFPPLGPPPTSSISSSPSVLQKITVMKDALLDNTQTPILAMWKDGSVTFPNRAARELFDKNIDFGVLSDGFDLLPAWTLWDENFTRQLEVDEYPISVLLRTEKPFTGFRIGMLDGNGKRLVYDAEGAAITDEHTGEFLAGVVTCRDVTQLTEEINNIKAADSERFKLICDTMPQLVWTARPDGSHDFFNSRWYSYTGLTEEESLGEGWELPFHPDDMEETQSRWKHSLHTGEPYMIEYRCRRKDGEWRWFLGRALPLRNKKTGEIEQWFGTCTDVHESIEAKLEASRTRQQLLSVMAHSQMTMFTVDLEAKVTMLEGALIWGMDSHTHRPKWYLGQDVYQVFNELNSQLEEGQMPPFLEPLKSILAGLEKDEMQEHEMDGRWYRIRFQPLMKKNREGSTMEGVIGLILDVTELKNRDRDIEAREREKRGLVAAEAAAKEASRMKSQFLANMSHEIRTPISGVIGMAELLLDHKDLPQEPRELSENIYRSANALLTVINDILDFSKIESGHLDVEEVRFSLSIIIRDVLKMLSFAADKKNLDFQSNISIDIDQDLVVLGDPGRVRQIITNLLTNSIKFTNQGFVRFSVNIEKEEADVVEVKFMVEDTGIGIEEDVRRRLFQPFSQGDASTARRFGGTGLGLTISKNLLDLMNGRITLESTLGSGTTATFWVPFKRPQHEADGVRKSNLALVQIGAMPDRLQAEMSVSCNSSEYEQILGTPPGELAGSRLDKNRTPWRNPSISSLNIEDELSAADRANIHILVVEDNPINQKIAIMNIRKLGFQVTAAWNGKEALEYVTAAREGTKRKPDVILMDVQMPIIDGYKCTHLLRHHLPYKTYVSDVPIVAMTASAIQGDMEKCKKAGMDDYLAKPVQSKTLEGMLLRWLTSGRPRISTAGSVKSDCSEASERCNNADIPVVGVQDEDVAMSKKNDVYDQDDVITPGDEKANNLPTPRPISHDRPGLLGDGYFGRDTITPATAGTKSPDREYTTRTLASPSPHTQASMLNAGTTNNLPSPMAEPLPASIFKGHHEAGEASPLDGEVTSPMNKIIAAEMAMQGRDDKLMEAAMGSNSVGHGHAHSYGKEPGDSLTVENIGRLEEEGRKKSA